MPDNLKNEESEYGLLLFFFSGAIAEAFKKEDKTSLEEPVTKANETGKVLKNTQLTKPASTRNVFDILFNVSSC